MEELTMDSLINGGDLDLDSLFTDNSEEENTDSATVENVEKKNITEDEIDIDSLFDPEGVGDEETIDKDGKTPESKQEDGSSPESNNFYSSIATACKEEGIFPDLDDESLNEIKDAEGFKEAMNRQLQAMLDERQKRISEALEYGVEPDAVQKYERALDYLENISEDTLKDEERGENLRRQLIFNDYLNRGFSQERAQKYTQRSFDQGTDIEDAIEAKNSNKEYFSSQYNRLLEQAKEQAEEEAVEQKKRAESIKKSIMDTEEPFEGVRLDKVTRQRVYDLIAKPVFKDNDGSMYTALQKAQKDDEEGFIKKLGYLYVLTDGFKSLDGLVKDKVQKETKKGFRKIEAALRTPPTGGSLRFASGVDMEDSTQSSGILIDV